MKKSVLLAIAMTVIFMANAQTWSLDKSHSKLGFSATHLLISSVEGSFHSFQASINSSKKDFSDAVIELSADVNSIDTDDAKRDTHLKSPDFFDASKHTTLLFKSTSLQKTGKNSYILKGNLTMHGITKPVELNATFGGTAVHPYSKQTMAGFKVSGTVKRTDFGIGANIPAAMVSDEIVISANTEFAKN